MREILYRGKIEGNGVWTFGAYYHQTEFYGEQCDYHLIISSCDELEDNMMWRDNVYPETIGQFTGLTDKNGIKIFEGDIVSFGISQRIMYVHWNDETLTWELTDVGVSACEVNHLFNTVDLAEIQVESAYGEMFSEVIGNIYDNPELLGGVKNG